MDIVIESCDKVGGFMPFCLYLTFTNLSYTPKSVWSFEIVMVNCLDMEEWQSLYIYIFEFEAYLCYYLLARMFCVGFLYVKLGEFSEALVNLFICTHN